MKSNVTLPEKPSALYVKVKDEMLQRIQSNTWKPYSMIPTEVELMQEFQVSRTTIRQAVSILVQEGILNRKQGKGTIVKPHKFIGTLGKLKGFAEEAMEKGMTPSSKVLRVNISTDFEVERTRLNLPKGVKICVIERLRFADSMPIAIERSSWPYSIGQYLLQHDLNGATFYDILQKNGVELQTAKEKITAINATIDEADLLGIRGGQALLRMERLSFTSQGHPIEYTTTKFCSDKYQYYIDLKR
ncbi:GntR family transcriptional regulator [Bacillus weihaiensis]|uniref:GntR family transcriptional regulator n=1 Tax=Bacillus weihaiensis TaxID=1547283 RepID=A0A1L3MM54_9BACI|nr:GntR family transcriptional regulator [Bacillus weihaiensis]APH03435.1 GntR family transcriptional regulator [Bacillus weihaiensis]